jgi:outer membrane beta-barrel protein
MQRLVLKFAPLALASLLLAGTAVAHDGHGDHAHPNTAIEDGLAQDDEGDSEDEDSDDDFDDLFGDPDDESVEDEQEAVRSGDIDDRVGVVSEDILKAKNLKTERLIKTIQRKNFLKLGRFETSPYVGFVSNDPFINRYLFGVGGAYHVTEIFAIEANLGYAPNLGQADWKPLTKQLVEKNKVSPDISKLTLFTNFGFQFSPIYGKVAINGRRVVNFDIFAAFGLGTTYTQDDLEALGDDSPEAKATANQWHPTTNIGGGARVVFNDMIAFRIEGRSLVYIETIASKTLEMKNNFILVASTSVFIPSMNR